MCVGDSVRLATERDLIPWGSVPSFRARERNLIDLIQGDFATTREVKVVRNLFFCQKKEKEVFFMSMLELGGGGTGAVTVIGTWDAATDTAVVGGVTYNTYAAILTENREALVVSVAGTTTVNGFTNWTVGEYLVRDSGIYFKEARGQDPTFGLSENAVPVFRSGALADSAITESSTRILVGMRADFPDNGLRQTAISREERGGFSQNTVATSGRKYILMDYEINDTTGTSNPKWYPRAAKETRVVIQSDDSVTMSDITSIDLTLTANSDVSRFYFNLASAVTGLRARIVSTATSEPIKYFPSEADWVAGVGTDFAAGENSIQFTTPLAALGDLFNLSLELEADSQIDLLGDGTNIWYAVDRQIVTFDGIDLLHDNNIVDSVEAIVVAGTGVTVTRVGETLVVASSFTPRTDEEIQDVVGAMVTNNTETGIEVTYQDTDGTLDFVVTGTPQPPMSTDDLYLAATTDALANSVDITTATSSSEVNPTLTIPTFTGNRYLQILQSMIHSRFTGITIDGINQIGAFTITDNARAIGSQMYRQYVSTNLLTDAISGDTIILGGAS